MTMRYGRWYWLANSLAFSLASSSSIPTTTTLRLAYCCDSLAIDGASALHGPHHDAKKFKYTACPRRADRCTAPLPLAASGKVKSGAGAPTCGGAAPSAARAVNPTHSAMTISAKLDQANGRDPHGFMFADVPSTNER